MNSLANSGTTLPVATRLDRVCTFWVDGIYLGVDVSEVQEVLRYHDMTVVPRAPESVLGLINLRGQIITAIDLRSRLGLPDRPEGDLPMNVIVRSEGESISLLVDDIGDVIATDELALEPAPVNLPSPVRGALRGVMPMPETLLLILAVDRVVDVSAEPNTTGGNK
jgi:purine-binding chemotaxis protein CheW